MNKPEDCRHPDLDWIGCEALLSVPAFGRSPAESSDAACGDAGAANRWAAGQSTLPLAAAPGRSLG